MEYKVLMLLFDIYMFESQHPMADTIADIFKLLFCDKGIADQDPDL